MKHFFYGITLFCSILLGGCSSPPAVRDCSTFDIASDHNLETELYQKSTPPISQKSPDFSLENSEPRSNKTVPLLMAHYLPWFQTPEISGYWGNHWTMKTCNPEVLNEAGQRTICSHFYPMIGPYDSIDPDLLEYHMLLMKLSGIDGIFVDWYGSINHYDWGQLEKATKVIMQTFNDNGFKVGIVYEDRTIKVGLQRGFIEDGIAAAQKDIRYLEETYFQLENYIRVDNVPLLLNFGPSQFKTAQEWQTILSVSSMPALYNGLSYLCGASYTNFPWIELPGNPDYLKHYYAWIHWARLPYAIGAAYPGFHDYYNEGGWGDNLYYLDYLKGDRFGQTLELNRSYYPNIIQLNTWNDWNEGTMIEPSVEFGYRFLEDLQAFKKLPFKRSALELATRIFKYRKIYTHDNDRQALLDNASAALFRGNVDDARRQLQMIIETHDKDGKFKHLR